MAGDVTVLLGRLTAGERGAFDELLPLVYDELRAIAHGRLRGERADHTLSTTGLVHEAYLRLVGIEGLDLHDRTHFFAICARAMRRVLLDYADRVNAAKRGGGAPRLTLTERIRGSEPRPTDFFALNLALEGLERRDERACRVVECRFFAGLSIPETAQALDLSPATVKREWAAARAWLNRELTG
jgi:RNA polymerase sigma factor (TIGR02999 family)